jgi:DNA-binding MarR family transcriptional regulator
MAGLIMTACRREQYTPSASAAHGSHAVKVTVHWFQAGKCSTYGMYTMASTRKLATVNGGEPPESDTADVWWLLQEVAALCRRLSDRQYAVAGSSADQVQALRTLAGGDALTVGELSRQLGLERNSGSQLVERLVQRHLVQRTRSTDDRRRVQIAISAEGRTLLELVRPSTLSMIAAATREIPTQQFSAGFDLLSAMRAGTSAVLQSSEHAAWRDDAQQPA